MAKIYLSELSAVLAEKHGIDRRTAQRFVTSVVAVIQSGLETDRMVKIKGLGTFKVIDVEARESVNVNTGERLVIDGHSKLTFLPDNAMKELVNKPFSQFETVVLNDGVEFGDEQEEESESHDLEEESSAIEEEAPVVEEEEASIEQEVDAPIEEEIEATVEEEKEAPVEEETAETTSSSAESEENIYVLSDGWRRVEDVENENAPRPSNVKKFGWGHLAATAVIALLVGGAAGYMIARGNGDGALEEPQQQTAQTTQASQTAQTTQTAQTVTTTEQSQTAEDQASTEEMPAESKTEPQVEENNATPIWEKYNDMDPRTRNGYYYITGQDRVEKAKAGDTSSRLARRYFGAAELACYIEVFNGIDGRTVLDEGTEVKIPKIESKKAVRKRLEQQNNQQ